LDLESARQFASQSEANATNHEIRNIEVQPPREIVILGAGLAGLSAAYTAARGGMRVIVLEGDSTVGGLAKTVNHRGFRFDLGGHRFITRSKKVERFVMDILKGDFLVVPRKSKIYMLNRYFDYPLKPANAIFGLGPSTTLQIIWDYFKEKVKQRVKQPHIISLEDWVVNQFGRKMFDLYFSQYSEKVWGIEPKKISQEWVAQRIEGLSLWRAIKNGFFRLSGKEIPTLSDQFIYPSMGIGQISDRLRDSIEEENPVLTGTRVCQIHHEDFFIKHVMAKNYKHFYKVEGSDFVSSIPLTNLVQILQPEPPADVLEAASQLKYRDIVIVTIMLSRERVTELTWLYLPEKKIPLGRLHEPRNWSPHTAPEGKTHLVSEYFCFKDDKIWNLSDAGLTAMTVEHLEKLGFINKSEVIDSCVVRQTNAYPVFEVGYWKYYKRILEYLKQFKNLHTVGRTGMFRYHNMDHAMEAGINVAEEILSKQPLRRLRICS
jgi:protoporphyrinogen oxidase